MVDSLTNAKQLVTEFDEMWLVRVVLGSLCALGSWAGVVVLLNDCSKPVQCKEVVTERDQNMLF